MITLTSPALTLLSSMSSAGSTPSLVSILYGGGTASGGDPVAALIQAENNQPKAVANQEKDPQTKRDVNRFLAAVAKAPDLKTLLADPTARKVLLTANGLGDQSDYTALATKALMSDTTKPGNLASKLSDTRWSKMAKTYDFANQGLAVLKQQSVLDTIASGYAEVQWRQSLDKTTPGLSAALDFRSRAATIANVDQILGDANLREVVTTALGIPKEIAYQTLQAQEKAISDRVDITKFKDPKFVEQFTRRYLVAASSTASSGLLV